MADTTTDEGVTVPYVVRVETGYQDRDQYKIATLFQPGDYFTRQDGAAYGKNRIAGYMLSMTPAWRVDWGGALEFIGGTGHIAKGYVPSFNTLTVFAVPQAHFVSQVALHGGLRYAVSGWLRSAR